MIRPRIVSGNIENLTIPYCVYAWRIPCNLFCHCFLDVSIESSLWKTSRARKYDKSQSVTKQNQNQLFCFENSVTFQFHRRINRHSLKSTRSHIENVRHQSLVSKFANIYKILAVAHRRHQFAGPLWISGAIFVSGARFSLLEISGEHSHWTVRLASERLRGPIGLWWWNRRF